MLPIRRAPTHADGDGHAAKEARRRKEKGPAGFSYERAAPSGGKEARNPVQAGRGQPARAERS